jgi:hypothetical protein
MREFIVSPQAFRDLLEIWGYIAVDSREAADRVESEFYESFRILDECLDWVIAGLISRLKIFGSGRCIRI